MDAHIRYQSIYSSSKEYAEKLAELLTMQDIYAQAFDADHPVPVDDKPVVIFSYVHGPVIPAAKLATHISTESPLGRNIAAVAVGMTPIESAKAKDQMCSMVPDTCARFYVPGRLNYSTVQPSHKAIGSVQEPQRIAAGIDHEGPEEPPEEEGEAGEQERGEKVLGQEGPHARVVVGPHAPVAQAPPAPGVVRPAHRADQDEQDAGEDRHPRGRAHADAHQERRDGGDEARAADRFAGPVQRLPGGARRRTGRQNEKFLGYYDKEI